MRRDKSLHEISAGARIAALPEKQGRGRDGGGRDAIGRLDRDSVKGSLEWRTRGFFCGLLLSFTITRCIIPGWWV